MLKNSLQWPTTITPGQCGGNCPPVLYPPCLEEPALWNQLMAQRAAMVILGKPCCLLSVGWKGFIPF